MQQRQQRTCSNISIDTNTKYLEIQRYRTLSDSDRSGVATACYSDVTLCVTSLK